MVREQNAEQIRRIATAVSDPTSPEYTNYLTTAEVLAMTAPLAEDMGAVTGWLEASGVGYQVRHSNVIAAMPVATAAKLFSTTFHVAEHKANAQALIRAADYELPAEVEASVQTVFGLHGLPLPPRQAVVAAAHLRLQEEARPKMPANVTPAVLASTYGIKGKGSHSTKNVQAVAEFQGQFSKFTSNLPLRVILGSFSDRLRVVTVNSTDLAKMFAAYVTDYTVGTDDVVSKFVGKHIENSGGIEAELDIQFIMQVHSNLPCL